jgi:hypothetical protein
MESLICPVGEGAGHHGPDFGRFCRPMMVSHDRRILRSETPVFKEEGRASCGTAIDSVVFFTICPHCVFSYSIRSVRVGGSHDIQPMSLVSALALFLLMLAFPV